jgi:hypothetical protein
MATSTSAAHASPPPTVLEEIEALFSWNPPPFFTGSKKLSTSSRLSAYYDKHLSAKFVLKRVERLPSLVQVLTNKVNEALEAAKPSLPLLPSHTFISAKQRLHDELVRYNMEARNEKAIANFYDKYTSQYCLPVASMLAFHPATSECILDWAQSVSSSGYAIVDGELRIMKDSGHREATKLHRASIWATVNLKASDRRLLELMRDSELTLATWEIKGLGAGTAEVMSAVRNLGAFSWTTCSFKREKCYEIKSHRTALDNVDKIDVGHDAKHFPWFQSLARPAEAGPSTLPPSTLPPLTLPPPSRSLSPLSSLPSLTTEDEEPSARKKRKRDDEDNNGNDDNNNDDDNGAFQDRHDVTAQNLVQQVTHHTT